MGRSAAEGTARSVHREGRGLGLKNSERGFKNKYEWLCRGKVDGFHFDGKSEDFETSK